MLGTAAISATNMITTGVATAGIAILSTAALGVVSKTNSNKGKRAHQGGEMTTNSGKAAPSYLLRMSKRQKETGSLNMSTTQLAALRRMPGGKALVDAEPKTKPTAPSMVDLVGNMMHNATKPLFDTNDNNLISPLEQFLNKEHQHQQQKADANAMELIEICGKKGKNNGQFNHQNALNKTIELPPNYKVIINTQVMVAMEDHSMYFDLWTKLLHPISEYQCKRIMAYSDNIRINDLKMNEAGIRKALGYKRKNIRRESNQTSEQRTLPNT